MKRNGVLRVFEVAWPLLCAGVAEYLLWRDIISTLMRQEFNGQHLVTLLAEGLAAGALAALYLWLWWDQRRMKRRQVARATILDRLPSAERLLARTQPRARAIVSGVPIVVELRLSRSRLLLSWALWIAACFAVAGLAYGVSILHGTGDSFFSTWGIVAALVAAPFGLVVLVARRERVEVSEHGLTVTTRSRVRTVYFGQANTFAVAGRTLVTKKPTMYALSSNNLTVYWMRWQPRTILAVWDLATIMAPTIPGREYEQQMEALLGAIAAGTGLPLYELP